MKKRVLCIEDHHETYNLISAILDDYDVIAARDLRDALQKATAEKFDLYLVDYYLPDGLALEFILYVKGQNAETPILIVTGSSAVIESQAERFGANGIIKKASVSFVEDLRNQVGQLLNQH